MRKSQLRFQLATGLAELKDKRNEKKARKRDEAVYTFRDEREPVIRRFHLAKGLLIHSI